MRFQLIAVYDNFDDAIGRLESGFQRVRQASAIFFAHDQPVHHNRDAVVLVAVQAWRSFQLDQLAIDARTHKTFLARVIEQIAKFTLAPAYQGREHFDLAPGRPAQNLVSNLAGRLPAHGPPTRWTVRHTNTRPQKPQIVVDLRDRAYRGARVSARGFLLDRDGGRQPFDHIDIRLLHDAQELAGISRQRLDVTAL